MPQTELYRRTPDFNDWRPVASGRHAEALIQFAEAQFGAQYQRHDLEVRAGEKILARRHHHHTSWVFTEPARAGRAAAKTDRAQPSPPTGR